MKDTELVGLEREVYRSRFDDGLVDILFGMVAAAWGGGLALGVGYLGALAAAMAVGLWPLLEALVRRPRTGYVELSHRRRAAETRKAWLLVAVGGGFLALGLLAAVTLRGAVGGSALAALGAGLGGFLLAVPALLAAALTGVGRFGVHGVVLAAGGVVGVLGWAGPEVYAPVCGGIVVAVGLVRLARFLRDHPAQEA